MDENRLDADVQQALERALLRVPHERLRLNLKSAQRHIEVAKTQKTFAGDKDVLQADRAVEMIDVTLGKARTLKQKLGSLVQEEQKLCSQQRARIEHLQDLHAISSVADPRYDGWARTRLNRLLVDHMLRLGYVEAAQKMAQETETENLTDIDLFVESSRIEKSLRKGELKPCLAWCTEHKQMLKKLKSTLDLDLRQQQLIESARSGDSSVLVDALKHARTHFSSKSAPGDQKFGLEAGGLLAHSPDMAVQPYHGLYSPSRYAELADKFVQTQLELVGALDVALLHPVLLSGISALKTPQCSSARREINNTKALSMAVTSSTCPICSPELNELARPLPFGHHDKSHVDEDLVVLPNGRVINHGRLQLLNQKLKVPKGKIRDPFSTTGEEWIESVVRKVFVF
ncbi:protein FYV10 [Piedraia hortae CBS 480.64]|uniref:Protein FYV10 n=1 Tax=Piedraia hortae CBS 480.64 TaxID=1314780 RepID=A0A6A7BUQ3_9PEZI|nr:protein FYV10 [Piedraia hortae CBS 480.64]